MSRQLAVRLVDQAARLLPARHARWGAAMRAELAHVDDGEAIGFAAGCLLAGITERIRSMGNVVTLGRWTVGVATGSYALFHLVSSLTFIPMLVGGTAAEAAPFIFAYMLAMGVTHAAAAWFLVRRRGRAFKAAWWSAAAVSGVMTVTILAASGSMRGLGLQPALLLLLAGAAYLLNRWSTNPRMA